MSGQHARLAPSAAGRWVKCPGSRALCEAYPEPADTEPAMEGTAAHWVIEQTLANRMQYPEPGTLAPNGVEVTEEMLEGAETFIDVIGQDHGGHIESRVTMARTIHPENWGTPDFYGLRGGERGAILRMVDYKFGHEYVEEFENWQCIDYVAGVCEKLDVRPEHGTQVEITIVQPRHFGRNGPVRTWSTSVEALQPYFEKLRNAAAMAMLDESPCFTGDQCKHCSGRHACEALQRETGTVIDHAYSNLPLELPLPAAARELDALTSAAKRMAARITGLTEQLLVAGRSGANIPGWGVARAEGRQKWNKPIPEVIALGQLMGVNVVKPAVITPKQAMKAGMLESVVNGASEVPLGEWKLERIDPRAAVKAFS